jgi:hypothetical protein
MGAAETAPRAPGSASLDAIAATLHGTSRTRISAAPAQYVRYRLIDLGVGWLGMPLQQPGCSDHLPGLTISALRNLLRDPCLYHGVLQIAGNAFDRYDLRAAQTGRLLQACRPRLAIHQHRTDPANADPAAVLGAFQSQRVPQYPQQWGVRRAGKRCRLAIDLECDHSCLPEIQDLHRDRGMLPTSAMNTIPEAVLGARRTVLTLGGQVEVTIPQGTQPDTVLRIGVKGLPEFGGRAQGDLFLRLRAFKCRTG